MIALLQRVTSAAVTIAEQTVGEIERGIVVLLGVEAGDDEQAADKIVKKISAYRLFADAEGKTNLNVQQVAGSVLVVSQFTLAADTQKGLRPSFSSAADPALANGLYQRVVSGLAQIVPVATGEFGADMQVSLTNDGPMTFILHS